MVLKQLNQNFHPMKEALMRWKQLNQNFHPMKEALMR